MNAKKPFAAGERPSSEEGREKIGTEVTVLQGARRPSRFHTEAASKFTGRKRSIVEDANDFALNVVPSFSRNDIDVRDGPVHTRRPSIRAQTTHIQAIQVDSRNLPAEETPTSAKAQLWHAGRMHAASSSAADCSSPTSVSPRSRVRSNSFVLNGVQAEAVHDVVPEEAEALHGNEVTKIGQEHMTREELQDCEKNEDSSGSSSLSTSSSEDKYSTEAEAAEDNVVAPVTPELKRPVRRFSVNRWSRPSIARQNTSKTLDVLSATLPWIYSTTANLFFGGMIMVNSVYIGIETDCSDMMPEGFWICCESLFVLIFGIELALRYIHHDQAPRGVDEEPKPFLQCFWNIMDLLIVVVGFIDTFICTLLLSQMLSWLKDDVSDGAFALSIMRLLRAFRLIRVLRIFRFLHELMVLAQGIAGAMKALVWAILLVAMTLYTGAIFTTRTIGQQPGSPTIFHDWFGDVLNSFFTLFQLMTLEGWNDVARVAMDDGSWWTVVFFMVFVMFTNLVLLNLVTGVILENVLRASQKEEEKELQKAEALRMHTVQKIHRLFAAALGNEYSQEITLSQFREACLNPKVIRHLMDLHIPPHEAQELFVLMDTSKRGFIDIDHFIEGCLRIRGMARAKHLLGVQYDVQKVWQKLSLQLDEVEDRLSDEIGRRLSEQPDNKRCQISRSRSSSRRNSPSRYTSQNSYTAMNSNQSLSEIATRHSASTLPVTAGSSIRSRAIETPRRLSGDSSMAGTSALAPASATSSANITFTEELLTHRRLSGEADKSEFASETRGTSKEAACKWTQSSQDIVRSRRPSTCSKTTNMTVTSNRNNLIRGPSKTKPISNNEIESMAKRIQILQREEATLRRKLDQVVRLREAEVQALTKKLSGQAHGVEGEHQGQTYSTMTSRRGSFTDGPGGADNRVRPFSVDTIQDSSNPPSHRESRLGLSMLDAEFGNVDTVLTGMLALAVEELPPSDTDNPITK